MDRERVLRAWECCNPFNRKCNECPYEKDCYHDGISRHMVADAIELLKEQEDLGTELTNAVELIRKKNERIEKLLKEQEPVKPVNVRWKMGINGGNCPKCMNWVQRTYNYCPFCGRSVK